MERSLQHIQQKLSSRSIKLSEVVAYYLGNIEKHAECNAMVNVFADYATKQASIIQDKIDKGVKLGKLYGAVISIKDNICMKDMPVTAGSDILKGYCSPYSATVVERLIEEDAIIIGTTNLDQFGMGSTSSNSAYGSVINGKGNNLIAGGSSGGAAVAVQMDMCLLALGSDTGGSVRQPAALCDVIGMKPSYGSVSRWGLIAYGSSFDVIGVIGHNIADIKLTYEVISGVDEYDSTMLEAAPDDGQKASTFAIVTDMFDVNNVFTEEVKHAAFHKYGRENFTEVSFDFMKYLIPCYYILTTAEASSNLSRYDGVRYGHRAKNPDDLQDLYTRSRTEGFGKEVKKRIMLGTFVLSEGYFDAYYTKAQKIRRLITNQINDILDKYDAIVMPVTPGPAWTHDKKIDDPLEIYLSDVFTVLANITGMPSISAPVEHNGKLVNMQLMMKKGCDFKLLNTVLNK
jgi:aspartyl-tRNA(Asn)/glutamyl-tRNA(Gln) amidotransferase subunit A